MGSLDRAVAVSVRADRLLVVRRSKYGRRYAVLPGGGVEPGESASAAAIRELREETGLAGEIVQHLWTIEHPDRRADYFLVEVPEAPMVMAGPEAERQTPENTYEPCWIRLEDLDSEGLQPETIRPLIRQLAGTV